MPFRAIREKISDALVLFGVVVVLTGCATQTPRPVAVSLDRQDVKVRLADGRTCTGPVEAVPLARTVTVSGAGPLQRCGADLTYRVTGETGTNPVRLALEQVFTAIGLPDAIAPRAEVEIAAPDGRSWIFASPPGS